MGFTNFEEWDADLSRAVAELPEGAIIKLQRKLVFMALGAAVELSPGRYRKIPGVVLMTPVLTGRARSSWNVSVGDPSLVVPPAGRGYRKTPNKAADAQRLLRRLGRFQAVWITSSLPYIEILEYGGYPDPVARGSWDRKLKRWEIRSSGGYSRQAPKGMVRVTFGQIRAALSG